MLIMRDSPLKRYGPYLLLLLPLSLLMAYPIFLVIKEAFLDGSGGLTAEHIRWVVTDDRSREVITFTVLQAFASAVITVVLAAPGAYLLALHGKRSKQFVLALSTVPFVLPPLVLALGFIPLFGNTGYLNGIMDALSEITGTQLPHIGLLYTRWGILLAHIFLNFPLALRLLYQRIAAMGPGPARASRSLGAGPFRTFISVILPELWMPIAAALSLVFTFCLLSFGVVLVIGGLANATLEVEIYRQMVGHFDAHKAGALLLVELLLALGSTSLFLAASRKAHPAVIPEGAPVGQVSPLKWRGRLLSGVYAAVISLIILGPMVSVVIGSLSSGPGTGGDLTLSWFGKVLSRESDPVLGATPFGSVVNSLAIGIISTICALVIGSAVAALLDSERFRGKGAVDALLLLPIGVSTVSLGFGLISASVAGPIDLRGSWPIVVIVHTLISYPLAAMVLLSARRVVPGNLVRAARSLGDRGPEVTLNIRLPLMAPGILTAAVLCFAISIGEMGATMMVAPSGLTTMPLALYRFISGGRDFGAASAYAVIMLLFTVGSFLVVQWTVGLLKGAGVGRSD